MKKDQIEKCKTLIRDFDECLDLKQKQIIRNNLFFLMQPSIIKWYKDILSKKGLFIEMAELRSKSWDCFEFCLRLYKEEKKIPIPSHFYKYTNFFILNSLITPLKEEEINHNENNEEIDNFMSVLETVDEFKMFRSILPEEYVSVFDDALMSMAPANSQRLQRQKESGIPIARYQEAKKIFKIVIDFLLVK
jgi:uncharacterized membrane protein